MKNDGNVLRWLEMGWECVHLRPTAISYRLKATLDPKSHRNIPKIYIFRKIESSEIWESAGVGGNGRSPFNWGKHLHVREHEVHLAWHTNALPLSQTCVLQNSILRCLNRCIDLWGNCIMLKIDRFKARTCICWMNTRTHLGNIQTFGVTMVQLGQGTTWHNSQR